LSKITTRMKRHVRFKLKDEKHTIWVGKDGFTPQLANEIENQLGKQKMVKIRILPSALQQETTAQTIAAQAAEATSAALVEVRGHVFILYRRHKKPQP
jgi:RNA-binding protein